MPSDVELVGIIIGGIVGSCIALNIVWCIFVCCCEMIVDCTHQPSEQEKRVQEVRESLQEEADRKQRADMYNAFAFSKV